QVIEDQTRVPRQSSHFLRHAPGAFGLEHADGETAKPRDVFRAVTGADATAVFIIVPVDDVVTTVLNRPVTAVDFENLMRAGLRTVVTTSSTGTMMKTAVASAP